MTLAPAIGNPLVPPGGVENPGGKPGFSAALFIASQLS
ncbi:hypothetical protein ACVI1L_004504 [Bradyrhizobium sp. USDA 4516]|nr:hypothetical protein [Bradyrhizobium sp. USDA 4541]